MKPETGRAKKPKVGRSAGIKPPCGTLSYLAECRGNGQKAGSSRLPAQPDGMNRILRKHPADK